MIFVLKKSDELQTFLTRANIKINCNPQHYKTASMCGRASACMSAVIGSMFVFECGAQWLILAGSLFPGRGHTSGSGGGAFCLCARAQNVSAH